MATLRIVTTRDPDHAVLRGKAARVQKFDRSLRRLVFDMVETMRQAPGVGLAAPQVGLGLRIVVVETPVEETSAVDGETMRLWAVVNPDIEWRSPEQEEGQEACLSIPGLYGDVVRHRAIRVRGQDTKGRALVIEAEDYEARVFQHEIDHLDGVLFPDRICSLDKLYTLRATETGDFERVPYQPPA